MINLQILQISEDFDFFLKIRIRIGDWLSNGSCFVRQLVMSYPFSLPSLKKRVEEKENKVAKLILTTFFHRFHH